MKPMNNRHQLTRRQKIGQTTIMPPNRKLTIELGGNSPVSLERPKFQLKQNP